MNREQVRQYIHLCKEANIPASSTLKALEKRAGGKDLIRSIWKAISAAKPSTSGIGQGARDTQNHIIKTLTGNPVKSVAGLSIATGAGLSSILNSSASAENKDLHKILEADKSQQVDWMLRGGALGGGLGALLAPLLAEKNPGISSMLGGTTGAVLGSLGGALYSKQLGNK